MDGSGEECDVASPCPAEAGETLAARRPERKCDEVRKIDFEGPSFEGSLFLWRRKMLVPGALKWTPGALNRTLGRVAGFKMSEEGSENDEIFLKKASAWPRGRSDVGPLWVVRILLVEVPRRRLSERCVSTCVPLRFQTPHARGRGGRGKMIESRVADTDNVFFLEYVPLESRGRVADQENGHVRIK